MGRHAKGQEIIQVEPLEIFNKTDGIFIYSYPIYPFEYLIPATSSPPMLTIQINLSLINQNDARKVKGNVWNILKEHLPANPKGTIREPEELSFIYAIKEETFQNYIKWYDLHIKEKIGFRLIAFLEEQEMGNPVKARELLKRLKEMNKNYKVRETIKGEDNVQKGVKNIYRAIFRRTYKRNVVKNIFETYNCPNHRRDCPKSCHYQKEWIARFKRVYYAGGNNPYEIITEGDKLEELAYHAETGFHKWKRKPTQQEKQKAKRY